MIHIDAVSKTYGTAVRPVYALRDVSLRIGEGEFVAVMGPSGSGKSTLLTALGTMNPPSQGRVLLDNIDVYGLAPERRADLRHEYVGFVFQELQLLPYLTALENVLLGMVIARMTRREKLSRARNALVRVGLAGMEDRLPYQLSGGEQGRVAVARAVVNEPPLILADEPTGSLDSQSGAEILGLLRDLNRKHGTTVILVTHDPLIALATDRIVTLRDGRVQRDQPVGAADRQDLDAFRRSEIGRLIFGE
jgi:putative ABC transport system ATP-binding protein